MIGLCFGNSVALNTDLFDKYILKGGSDDCENVTEKNKHATEKQSRVSGENLLFISYRQNYFNFLPVFFNTTIGGLFAQFMFGLSGFDPMLKLPSTRSTLPSPSMSPASMVSHLPWLAPGKLYG